LGKATARFDDDRQECAGQKTRSETATKRSIFSALLAHKISLKALILLPLSS
jgi:hypothetical protein